MMMTIRSDVVAATLDEVENGIGLKMFMLMTHIPIHKMKFLIAVVSLSFANVVVR